MKRYLIADINIEEDKFEFYLLNNNEYIEFLENDGEIKKRDYITYSYKMKSDAKVFHNFKDLFNYINLNNIEIVNTYDLN